MLSRRHLLAACALGLPPLADAATAPRVVCVSGALTEIVYALGCESLLVGRDSTSVFPPAAMALPDVGYMRTLSAEGLLSLAPTLVLATEDAGPPAALRQLEAAGIALHTLRSEHRFEGLLARVERIGALLGRESAAQALVRTLRADWQQALSRVRQLSMGEQRPPRVLFVLAHNMAQLRIAGSATAADAVIGYAGARNALAEAQGYKQLTPEAAVAAAPEVILTTTEGLQTAGGIDRLLQVPGLAQTPAGRVRRVASFDALALLGFGPRLPQLLPRLAEALHQR